MIRKPQFTNDGIRHATINGHRFHLRLTDFTEDNFLWIDGQQPPIILDQTAAEFVALVIDGMWIYQGGSSEDDRAMGVALDVDGTLYVVGETKGEFEPKVALGKTDLFLIKFNGEGQEVYRHQFGTLEDDLRPRVRADGKGDIVVSGNTLGSLEENKSSGKTDFFLARFGVDGKMAWLKQDGGPDDDILQDLVVSGKGNIFVTGNTVGGLEGKTTSTEMENIFVARFDAEGDIVVAEDLPSCLQKHIF